MQTKLIFKALLDEKLGYATPISFEDWMKANHYEKISPSVNKWLYKQEQGYIQSMQDVTLKEIAEERIQEFTTALKKLYSLKFIKEISLCDADS